ncbi:MAG: hypothetical protein DRQ46_00385 [Gammaproteobacteria bacterium]|nr:MAG: hypothetical protein DRQ46_00385 [Gammaproteobacteria bacterium]
MTRSELLYKYTEVTRLYVDYLEMILNANIEYECGTRYKVGSFYMDWRDIYFAVNTVMPPDLVWAWMRVDAEVRESLEKWWQHKP